MDINKLLSSQSKPITRRNFYIYKKSTLLIQSIFFLFALIFILAPIYIIGLDNKLISQLLDSENFQRSKPFLILILFSPILLALFIVGVAVTINLITNIINLLNKPPYYNFIINLILILLILIIVMRYLYLIFIPLGLYSTIYNYIKIKNKR